MSLLSFARVALARRKFNGLTRDGFPVRIAFADRRYLFGYVWSPDGKRIGGGFPCVWDKRGTEREYGGGYNLTLRQAND